MNMAGLYDLFRKNEHENWYVPIFRHLNTSYEATESRLAQSFQFVTPETDNRRSYSPTFSSILRDVGSTFDSVMRELIEKSTREEYHGDILDHIAFLKIYCADLERLSVGFNYNWKTMLPFERTADAPPLWWTAYNKVKHQEVSDYAFGCLENAMKAVAGLAILRVMICDNATSRIFHNIALAYPIEDPSISESNRLFP